MCKFFFLKSHWKGEIWKSSNERQIKSFLENRLSGSKVGSSWIWMLWDFTFEKPFIFSFHWQPFSSSTFTFQYFRRQNVFLGFGLQSALSSWANAAKVWIFMPPHLATKYYLAPIVGFHNGAICYPKYFTPCYLKYPAAAFMTNLEFRQDVWIFVSCYP